jgi:intracellular sulfur oxidation DsrE/DsrF family protein
MRTATAFLLSLALLPAVPPSLAEPSTAPEGGAEMVYPPYEDAKVVYDFYLDDPHKIDAALFWIRALMNPLMEEPYDQAPDFMSIKVVIHGTEIVTVAKKNYEKYRNAVDRMRYYAGLGVEFKVCAMAAHDFGYGAEDFHDFVQLVPSAMTELMYWQHQGHALITPQVRDKKFSLEEIR